MDIRQIDPIVAELGDAGLFESVSAVIRVDRDAPDWDAPDWLVGRSTPRDQFHADVRCVDCGAHVRVRLYPGCDAMVKAYATADGRSWFLRLPIQDALPCPHWRPVTISGEQLMDLRQRLAITEDRLSLAKQALVDTGYFRPDQISDDIAPRIIETFDELYHFRMLYNAALFNEWAAAGRYDVHKSLRHADGEYCFGGGWFVVVAQLPTGQITNHYQTAQWNRFRVPTRDIAAEYDGHSPQDVADRLTALLDTEAHALDQVLTRAQAALTGASRRGRA